MTTRSISMTRTSRGAAGKRNRPTERPIPRRRRIHAAMMLASRAFVSPVLAGPLLAAPLLVATAAPAWAGPGAASGGAAVAAPIGAVVAAPAAGSVLAADRSLVVTVGLGAVALLILLILVVFVAMLPARRMSRSVNRLRDAVMTAATRGLPDALARLRRTPGLDDNATAALGPRPRRSWFGGPDSAGRSRPNGVLRLYAGGTCLGHQGLLSSSAAESGQPFLGVAEPVP